MVGSMLSAIKLETVETNFFLVSGVKVCCGNLEIAVKTLCLATLKVVCDRKKCPYTSVKRELNPLDVVVTDAVWKFLMSFSVLFTVADWP